MNQVVNKFNKLKQPKPGILRVVLDVLLLIVFGAWFFLAAIVLLVVKPDPDAYACGGPGFADFGCTGGSEAILASILNAIVLLFVFAVFVVAFKRLLYRTRTWRRR